jgi:hypothetical protein
MHPPQVNIAIYAEAILGFRGARPKRDSPE